MKLKIASCFHFNVCREIFQFISEALERKMSLLNKEDERLKTFARWPLNYPDPKTMAAVGLYYTGVGDITRCYFCKVNIHSWDQTDCPVTEHSRLTYRCPLLEGRETTNVPTISKNWNCTPSEIGVDVCGRGASKCSTIFLLLFTFITFNALNKVLCK